MQKFFTTTDNYSKKNVLEEELLEEWIPVEGSKCDFQSTARNIKFFIENTILIKKQKFTGNIVEYRPFFHIYMFTFENDKFNVFIPVDHASTFASLLKSIISPNALSTYFEKSVSHGWIVRTEYKNKSIVRKTFGKKIALDIIPIIDPSRKLPSFKFKWVRETTEFDVIVTLSEIDIIIERLNGFVNNAPIYNSLIHREMENEYLISKLEKIESIYNIVIENAKKIEDLSKRFDNVETNLKNEISTAFSSAVGTMMSYINSNRNSWTASSKDSENYNENNITEKMFIESKKEDEESSEINFVIGENEENTIPETDEIKEYFDQPNNSDQINEIDMSLELEIEKTMEMMDEDTSITEILNEEYNVDTGWDDNEIIEDIEDIEEKERKEKDKGFLDELAREVSTRKNIDYVEEVKNSRKERPITDIYPKQLIPLLSPDLMQAETKSSFMPDDINEYYETIDLKRMFKKVQMSNPNIFKESLVFNMLGDSFTKRNLSAMMINRGRIGIPATSILHAVSLFAAGYEEMNNVTNEQDKKKIADKYGKHVMKCFIENDLQKTDEGKKAMKYHNALCKDIFKEEDEKYIWRLFALDRMLIKDKFDYSYFEMKLDSLNENEKIYLLRALIDVYCLTWFSEQKHISLGSNTPGINMVDMFTLVNKPMYRFARTLIVNIILSSEDISKMKIKTVECLTTFAGVVKKMKWDTDIFKDSAITLLSYISYTVNNKINEFEVDDSGYLKGTSIYYGIPFEEPYNILKNMVNEIKKGQNK